MYEAKPYPCESSNLYGENMIFHIIFFLFYVSQVVLSPDCDLSLIQIHFIFFYICLWTLCLDGTTTIQSRSRRPLAHISFCIILLFHIQMQFFWIYYNPMLTILRNQCIGHLFH